MSVVSVVSIASGGCVVWEGRGEASLGRGGRGEGRHGWVEVGGERGGMAG